MTLDEVIKAFEDCIVPKNVFCNGCYKEDRCKITEVALHYLKEYRDYAKAVDERYAEIEKKHKDAYFMFVNAVADLEDNPPLTWSQLKAMEGKPVWVEVYDPIDEKTGWHTASWKLIEFINDEYFDARDSDGEQECFYKSENGWQAYRKERK